jgi:pantetheine-phosphate adenylyltransferase
MAQANRILSGGKLDTVFLTTSLEYAYLSSSSVKEIASFGGDVSHAVPEFVARQMYAKFSLDYDTIIEKYKDNDINK